VSTRASIVICLEATVPGGAASTSGDISQGTMSMCPAPECACGLVYVDGFVINDETAAICGTRTGDEDGGTRRPATDQAKR